MPDIAHAARTCDESAQCPAEASTLPGDIAGSAANDGGSPPRTRRQRTPQVGPAVTETGTPSFAAWASALTLGELEAALRKAVA